MKQALLAVDAILNTAQDALEDSLDQKTAPILPAIHRPYVQEAQGAVDAARERIRALVKSIQDVERN